MRWRFLVAVVMGYGLFMMEDLGVRAQVVIDEFVVRPNPEWVEFYNASGSAEYLRGYWLDDDRDFASDTGSSCLN